MNWSRLYLKNLFIFTKNYIPNFNYIHTSEYKNQDPQNFLFVI